MKEQKIFQQQISFLPELENRRELSYDNVMIGGMGGSAMPGRMLFFLDPVFPAWLHNDYGLPEKAEGKTLYVAISYSGNTAETLSFAREVMAKGMSLAVVSSGGALLDMARKKNLPYVTIPAGMPPREALVFMLRALLKILGKEMLLEEIAGVDVKSLGEGVLSWHEEEELPRTTLIYSSRKNATLGYIFKVMLNETAKLYAFNNVFPEFTHNEMQAVLSEANSELTEKIRVLMLFDEEDNGGVKKEMELFLAEALKNRIKVEQIKLPKGRANKLIHAFIAARTLAREVAERRNLPAEDIEVIESFKKKLKQ